MFPKSGVRMEADAHSQALCDISFGVPNKGVLPQGPPFMESLAERCPIP